MTAAPPLVRDALPGDAAACASICGPYVRDTVITFETSAPEAAAMADRIGAAQQRHAWLVAEQDGEVVGCAYGSTFRSRPAYDWSCETTVCLREGLRRTGAGRLLMEALLARLQQRGFRRCFAVITVPNPPSIGCTAPWDSGTRLGSNGSAGSPALGGTSSGCSATSATRRRLLPRSSDRSAGDHPVPGHGDAGRAHHVRLRRAERARQRPAPGALHRRPRGRRTRRS